MPISPIELKTKVMANNEASRLRENQKTQEAGQSALLAQNQDKVQGKADTIQQSENAEGREIKKDDEDAEHQRKEAEAKVRAKKAGEPEEKPETEPLPDPDGVRGFTIDIKA